MGVRLIDVPHVLFVGMPLIDVPSHRRVCVMGLRLIDVHLIDLSLTGVLFIGLPVRRASHRCTSHGRLPLIDESLIGMLLMAVPPIGLHLIDVSLIRVSLIRASLIDVSLMGVHHKRAFH
jgi:hypothetical protein